MGLVFIYFLFYYSKQKKKFKSAPHFKFNFCMIYMLQIEKYSQLRRALTERF